jgi:peptidoglycan/xylan/chitin deacetylase (PgdA/CDA1 family)
MTRKLLYFVQLVLLLAPSSLLAQSVAFTFDDGFDPQKQGKAAEWNQAILKALSDANLQSILFPIGNKVNSIVGIELVNAWGDAGHNIGNHTYLHMNLGSRNTPLDSFIADAEKNHALFNQMKGWVNLLRFPLLKEGETAKKRDSFRRWLLQNDYKTAPVSIDTSDWFYSSQFLAWRDENPDAELDGFKQVYLDHLWERANYYNSLSKQVLGRSVSHVFLLHTNAINAEFLPDIINLFNERGWKTIDANDAFEDPVYSTSPDVLPAGESILWSLAKEQGVAGLRYPAEDSRYEEVLKNFGY